MTTSITPFKKGDRVTVSGKGRTATWGQPAGTVTAVRRGAIFIQWDDLVVNDEMSPDEVEMMAVDASRFDLDRFGAGAFRPTPRQADLMIVAGTVTHKMAPRVKRLFDQMPEPKFVMAMGACTIGGGPYCKHGYHVVKGLDRLLPVDVYVPGCPPRPEALIDALLWLQNKISKSHRVTDRYWRKDFWKQFMFWKSEPRE